MSGGVIRGGEEGEDNLDNNVDNVDNLTKLEFDFCLETSVPGLGWSPSPLGSSI